MADGDGDKAFTQEQYDAMVAERDAVISNRDTILGEAKEAKEAARALKETLLKFDDVDLDEVKRLRESVAKADRKRAEEEGDFGKLETQLIDKHTAEMAQLVEKHTKASDESGIANAKLRTALDQHMKRADLVTAIVDKGGDPALLLPHAMGLVDVRETDDGYETFVVDDKGVEQFSDGMKTPTTFGEMVEGELMEKYPRAFDGTGSSGGGASKSNAGGGGNKRTVVPNSKDYWATLEDSDVEIQQT